MEYNQQNILLRKAKQIITDNNPTAKVTYALISIEEIESLSKTGKMEVAKSS